MDYWIIINSKPVGPIPRELLVSRGLTPDTKVWRSGMSDWEPARQVDDLADLLCAPEPPVAPCPPELPSVDAPQQPITTPAEPQSQPASQSAPQPAPQPCDEPCPNSYLGWNIAITLCCCQLGGLIGLVFSIMTRTRYSNGDLAGAKKMSTWAGTMVIISIILGLIALPFTILLGDIGSLSDYL